MEQAGQGVENPPMLFDLTQIVAATVLSVAWVRRVRSLG
jgi:hypothetical protein